MQPKQRSVQIMLAPATAAKAPQPSPALEKICARFMTIKKEIVNISYKFKEINILKQTL